MLLAKAPLEFGGTGVGRDPLEFVSKSCGAPPRPKLGRDPEEAASGFKDCRCLCTRVG